MRPTPSLIVSDLDGTLFGPDHQLAPETIAAIRRAHDRGLPLVAATGRSHWSAAPRLAPAGCISHVIGSNGATLFDLQRGVMVRSRLIDPDVAFETVRAIRRAIPSMVFGWETVEGLYAEEAFLAKRDPEAVRSTQAATLDHAALTGVVKLMAMQDELDEDELIPLIRSITPDGVTTTSSGIAFVEITGPDVHKGSSLRYFVDEQGIDIGEVIAFGDQPNDLSMLEAAGWGVAMGNAHASVHAVADEVIGHHADHAVADYLDALTTSTSVSR